MTPHFYQTQAVNEIINHVKNKKKHPLLYLVTGGGKTYIAQLLIEKSLKKNRSILFIVRRKNLVIQTFEKFKNYFPKHTHSLLMSGYKNLWKDNADIFVTSIDTLVRRKKELEQIKYQVSLCFIDEAHDATSQTYSKVIECLKNKIIIGMTATPFYIGNKAHTFWDCVVQPISAYDMIKYGYLSEITFYSPPSEIIYENLSIKQGEYKTSDLYKEVRKLYGDFKKYFKEYGLNKKTITFCVNIQHAKEIEKILKEYFCLKNVIRIDSQLELLEKKMCEKKLNTFIQNNESFHIVNVNMFSTGVDIPSLEIGFMLRPTLSVVLWYQQIGRLTRIAPGKTTAKIIDFTRNSETLGNPFIFNRKPDLQIKIKERIVQDEKIIRIKICKFCFLHVKYNIKICPSCKKELTTAKQTKEIKFDNQIKLIKQREFKYIKNEIVKRMKSINHLGNKKWNILYEDFGEDLFDSGLMPKKIENFIKRRESIKINIDNINKLIDMTI